MHVSYYVSEKCRSVIGAKFPLAIFQLRNSTSCINTSTSKEDDESKEEYDGIIGFFFFKIKEGICRT